MSLSNLITNASDNHTTERGVHMSRIRIDDLPVAENLTPEQEALIQGAGLKSFRPSLEALEGREVPAVLGTGFTLSPDGVLGVSGFSGGGGTYRTSVRMINGEVVVNRGGTSTARMGISEVTRIVYNGGNAPEIFTNNTHIASTFKGQEAQDSSFQLTSTDFTEGDHLPLNSRATDTSSGTRPNLKWQGAPPGTKSFVLVVEDLDAVGPSARRMHDGTSRVTHWLLDNIPEGTDSLSSDGVPPGAQEGRNAFWEGPAPPAGSGTHRYVFKLYALGEGFTAPAAGATQQQVMTAMEGHILGQTSIMGTYASAPRV
jgi:Raf kinase inhibitor-like YbhB/YbcL family protein